MKSSIFAALTAVLLSLTLSACVTVPYTSKKVDIQSIDELVSNQEYGEALDVVNNELENQPDNQTLQTKRQQIQILANQFETETINKAHALSEQDKWEDALSTLDHGLRQYPQGQRLQSEREKIYTQRRRYMEKLDFQATISRATCLRNELPLMKKRAEADRSDRTAQWEYSNLQSQSSDVTQRLINCARKSLLYDDIAQTEACLGQAERMQLSSEEKGHVTALRKRLKDKKKELSIRFQKTSEVQAKASSIKSGITLAISRKEFIRARRLLAQLSKVVPDDKEIPAYKKRYLDARDEYVATLIERGKSLYRSEKISDARAVWVNALDIDPDNKELIDLVKRADKVLQKLEELKKPE